METPENYYPYCSACGDWTRPHRILDTVYCGECGLWWAELPGIAPLVFGKYKGSNVYHMWSNDQRSYLRWMLLNIERLDIRLRLAILAQLDCLPDHWVKPAAPWWVQHLSLSLPCTADEIKRAYREASKVCHPDKGGTTEQMQRLNEAKTLALTYLERS